MEKRTSPIFFSLEQRTRITYATASQTPDSKTDRHIVAESRPEYAVIQIKGAKIQYPITRAKIFALTEDNHRHHLRIRAPLSGRLDAKKDKLMIYTGCVTLSGETLAGKLGGNYRAPEKLDPRVDLRRYSETEYDPSAEFGRLQLAVAILADCVGDDSAALAAHQQFHAEIVAQLRDNWTLTSEEIRQVIDLH